MTDPDRPGDLERYAVDCALYAAWGTEFWVPADPDYGFMEYFEAAVTRNLGLLWGFETLAEDMDRRGIVPPAEGEQATLVTDGGEVQWELLMGLAAITAHFAVYVEVKDYGEDTDAA